MVDHISLPFSCCLKSYGICIKSLKVPQMGKPVRSRSLSCPEPPNPQVQFGEAARTARRDFPFMVTGKPRVLTWQRRFIRKKKKAPSV